MGEEPPASFGIAGARVTHVWTDDPKDAQHVAKCSLELMKLVIAGIRSRAEGGREVGIGTP